MNKKMLGLWLAAATALTPVLATAAQAQDDRGFGRRIMERVQRAENNGEGRAPRARPQQQQQPQAQQPQPRVQQDGPRWQGRRGDGGGNGGEWRGRRMEAPQAAPQQQDGERWQGRRGFPRADDGQQGEWRGRRAQPAQPQATQQQDAPSRWEGRRGGFGTRIQRDAQRGYQPPAPGSVFDRDGDGRIERQYDRNRDNRVDERWDGNRNGRLDRRWDRNDDERLDRRWDRDRDNRLDRRWDRNGDGVRDRYTNGWNRGWRDDRRYNWYGHRQRYGHLYRMPRYYAPYRGWSYRQLHIGFSLRPLFYSSQYWINDPWYYRLPEVYGPYRWVRYYDDALLVDIYSGEVVDVINGFFW